jgi:fluoride exporter
MSAPAVRLYLAVALGSALGGACRWGLSVLLLAAPAGGFPWGTFAANVSGSFLIGLYATTFPGAGDGAEIRRQFVVTGFCGGYTTFSIFSLETLHLVEAGTMHLALVNVLASLAAWLAAVAAGDALGRRLRCAHG